MMELAQKLQIKPGMSGCIINQPPDLALPLEQVSTEVTCDYVIAFVSSVADVQTYAEEAIQRLKPDGVLWFCYPKKTGKIQTDISRDSGWDVVYEKEFRPVRQVAIDETWSALRFREQCYVKAKG